MASRSTRPAKKINKVSVISAVKSSNNKVKSYLVLAVIFVIIGVILLVKSMAATELWRPTADKPLTLGWILDGEVDPSKPLQAKDLNGNPIASADVYDIDGEYNSAATVAELHRQGKKVICYIDTGVYEDYRSDAAKFKAISPKIWGNSDDGWNGSYWLDIRRVDELKPIMTARLQMCKDKGFDSVEPDEIVNYTNDSGFPLTYADQLKYNKAVASWAHGIGISIGLKDDHEQAHDLAGDFDWMLDEECWAYDECITISDTGNGGPKGTFDSVTAFIKANKAAWVAEYPDGDNGNGQDYPANQRDKSQPSHLTKAKTDQICASSKANRINTAFYLTGLPANGGRTDCPPFDARGGTTTTPPPTTTPVVVNPTVSLAVSSTALKAPANFTITATSSLAANIDIMLNNTVVQSCSAAITCSKAYTNYQAGTYQFSTKATTADGGLGTSTKAVTVAQATTTTPPANKIPTVSLAGPSGTLTEPANFTLTATAADTDGTVTNVSLLVDGKSNGSSVSTAPFTFNFKQQTAGTHTYNVLATDNSGALSNISNTITVIVNPPSPTTTASVPSPVTISDTVDISFNFLSTCKPEYGCKMTVYWKPSPKAASYVVKRGDGTLLGTTTNTYYTEKNATTGVSYTYQVFAKNSAGTSAGSNVLKKTISCNWFVCTAN